MASYLSQIIDQLKEVEELTRDQPLEGDSIEQAVAARLHRVVTRVQGLDSASASPSLANTVVPMHNGYGSDVKPWQNQASTTPAVYDGWPSNTGSLSTSLQLADGHSDPVCRGAEHFNRASQAEQQQQDGALDMERELEQLQHAQRDPTYPMMDLSWIFQDAGPT